MKKSSSILLPENSGSQKQTYLEEIKEDVKEEEKKDSAYEDYVVP